MKIERHCIAHTFYHVSCLFRFEHRMSMMLPIIAYTFLHPFFLINSGLWGYWHCGLFWPIVPASGDSEDDCGEADGM
jgi:hypothetical protein